MVEAYADGIKAFQVALRIRTRLAEQDPENPAWQRSLALAYEKAADIAILAMNNEKGALALYQRSFKIYFDARKRAPTDLRNVSDMSIVITKMGELFWRQDAFDKSLGAYADAVRLRKQLVARNGAVPRWKQSLAQSHERLGNARFERKQYAAAVESLESAQFLLSELFDENTTDSRALIKLAHATDQVGNAKNLAGDATGALAAYRELAEHFQRLAQIAPDDQNWPRGHSYAVSRIADLQRDGDASAMSERDRESPAIQSSTKLPGPVRQPSEDTPPR